MADDVAEGERKARALFGDERYNKSRTEAPPSNRRDLLSLADEVVFGKVYARPGLSLQQRSMGTVAALTVLGHTNQLRVHMSAALQIGIPRTELAELVTQMAVYAGFPVALNAMEILDNCIAEYDVRKSGEQK